MNFKEKIEVLRLEKLRTKFPNDSADWLNRMWYGSTIKYTRGSSAPGIEKNIVEYIKLCGHQAEKRAVMGREVTAPDIRTPLGTIVGKKTYIPSTGTKGSADISAVVYGIAVLIEVKFGKDRQSEYQKKYEDAINNAGGFYFIAHDEEDFLIKFERLLSHPKMVLMANF
jgi:hypothetical protein